jgi:nucleotide-binding universal stress UspA family protein
VVRVYAPPAVPWREPGMESGEMAAAELSAVDDELATWRGKYPDVQVTVEVAPGVAGPFMADATRYAELAVVGSRGHIPLAGALLGSVSQHLLHHAHCPVAVVRECG